MHVALPATLELLAGHAAHVVEAGLPLYVPAEHAASCKQGKVEYGCQWIMHTQAGPRVCVYATLPVQDTPLALKVPVEQAVSRD